jgi:hypothetical protein
MRLAFKTAPQHTTWGAGLAIVQLRPPHTPGVLEPLARAFTQLG